MKKKMLFGSAVLSMGLLLAGCGDEEASTSKNSSSEEQTEATQNEAKVKVMDKK